MKQSAGDPITWTGDLDRDCAAKWCGLRAIAEMQKDESWWVCVYDADGEPAWSSADDEGRIVGGDMARSVAEWAMRAVAAEAALAAQITD